MCPASKCLPSLLIALLIALLPTGAHALDDGSRERADATGTSFVERFNWVSTKRWYVSDGWSNGAHQRCTWSGRNVALPVNGQLELSLNDKPYKGRSYSCAEIQTKEIYGYGTYEVRMRSGAASGLVSAFFTYTGPQNEDGRPHDEIDIEFLGKDSTIVQFNYFASATGEHEKIVDLGFDASKRSVDYAFEWLPDRIRWYIDGKLVHEVTRDPSAPFPSHASKIYLSIWNGQGELMDPWLGPSTYPGKPIRAIYERVAFTKAGEPCQFKGSIVCRNSASATQTRE